MAKLFILFKMPSGIWYARVQLFDGSFSNNKSIGCRDKAAAERKCMEWIVNKDIPNRMNSSEENRKNLGLDKISI